jgi:hypothetical protein
VGSWYGINIYIYILDKFLTNIGPDLEKRQHWFAEKKRKPM